MANSFDDVVNKQLNPAEKQFKNDLLDNLDLEKWPDRIDYVARHVARGSYTVGLQSNSPQTISDGKTFDDAVHDNYLRGISELAGNTRYRSALPANFQLGSLLVQFAGMIDGMEDVGYDTLDSGEVLSRLVTKNLKRSTSGDNANLAEELSMNIQTPRGLVTELCAIPEVAELVETALPDQYGGQSFSDQLANVDLTTQLWDHQFDALLHWINHDYNGYVNMATATGKTVLGLAAVAHSIDAGSLHPSDQDQLENEIGGETQPPKSSSSSKNVLIVTTDELLGVQWARLFQTHCHTPAEFTQIKDGSIHLPWGRIDIKSARGLDDVNPDEYRLAIFDEVHNYTKRGGWGSGLRKFVDSTCPVLALTGSETDALVRLSQQVESEFPKVFTYKHAQAIEDGIIPDFEWNLLFSDVDRESNTLSSLEKTANLAEGVLDFSPEGVSVNEKSLSDNFGGATPESIEAIAGTYQTGAQLASSIRDAGDGEGVGPTPDLESLASGLSNRSIHRLNLSTDLSPVIELAEGAIDREMPVLILTQSYQQAEEIWKELYDRHSEREVIRIEQDASPAEQDKMITRFDSAETDKKVLIGPGKHIGQGNDIQSVEVGINIARPGSGANASLVQRLGRLLREADSKDKVEFFHITGVQPASSIIAPDGESFVRNVAGFFGQVIAPDMDGIHKPPSVLLENDTVASNVAAMESVGYEHILARDQNTEIESAYASAIQQNVEDQVPTITTDWFFEAFPDANESTESELTGEQRETGNKELSVSIDPVVLSIVRMSVEKSSENGSLEKAAEESLELFLDAVENAEQDEVVNACKTIDEHSIALDCDPALEVAIESKIQDSDELNSPNEFIQYVITEWLGIDEQDNILRVNNYERFEGRVQELIQNKDIPCKTPDEVVQAALEARFQL